MGVLFKENNKVLEFDIIGYEFPDTQLEIESDDYDANWVTVSIKYSDGTVSFAEKDSQVQICV